MEQPSRRALRRAPSDSSRAPRIRGRRGSTLQRERRRWRHGVAMHQSHVVPDLHDALDREGAAAIARPESSFTRQVPSRLRRLNVACNVSRRFGLASQWPKLWRSRCTAPRSWDCIASARQAAELRAGRGSRYVGAVLQPAFTPRCGTRIDAVADPHRPSSPARWVVGRPLDAGRRTRYRHGPRKSERHATQRAARLLKDILQDKLDDAACGGCNGCRSASRTTTTSGFRRAPRRPAAGPWWPTARTSGRRPSR